MNNIMQDLFNYIKYGEGFFEGFSGDMWVGEEESHVWNEEFWKVIMNEIHNVRTYGFNMNDFRYYKHGDWFRLESSDCGLVHPLMFNNISFDEFELIGICERINRWETGWDRYNNENYQLIGSGYFSDVFRLNKKYVWKKYTNHDEDFSEDLYRDSEFLLALDGINIFPKLHAYIPNKGLIIEYVEGPTFYLYNFTKEERKIIFERLLEGFREARERGYVYRDVKEDNVIIKEGLHPVMVDVGYFDYDSPYLDLDEQWTFERIDFDMEYEINELRKLYDI